MSSRSPELKQTGQVSAPPQGWKRITSIGPGFLWMVSAAGSGELLFTPRVGAMYGYALLWGMVAAIAFKWCINREIGRFAVCTGTSLLQGFRKLPRGGKWAVWIIIAPQLFVAVAALGGLAGSAATALILVLPGDVRLWMSVSLLLSTALVFHGKYRIIERTAMLIGVALALAAIVAAASVGPSAGAIIAGLRPTLPADVDYAEILPWLGFMLSGAAGMVWYSYWIPAKGYGLARGAEVDQATGNVRELSREDQRRLRGWVSQMTLDNTVAVVGTFVIAAAFLVLGAELLRPEGLVPEERRVAATLGRLLGDVWGPVGFWFMIVAVFVGFWDTVLSDQDGHARVFTEASAIVIPALGKMNERVRRRFFVIVLLTAMPLALYWLVGEPVTLLKLAGAVEAAHIPFVALLAVFLNRRHLPESVRPSLVSLVATLVGATFFAAFAAYYVWTLL